MFTYNKSELAMNRMLIKRILNTCFLFVNFALIYFSNFQTTMFGTDAIFYGFSHHLFR